MHSSECRHYVDRFWLAVRSSPETTLQSQNFRTVGFSLNCFIYFVTIHYIPHHNLWITMHAKSYVSNNENDFIRSTEGKIQFFLFFNTFVNFSCRRETYCGRKIYLWNAHQLLMYNVMVFFIITLVKDGFYLYFETMICKYTSTSRQWYTQTLSEAADTICDPLSVKCIWNQGKLKLNSCFQLEIPYIGNFSCREIFAKMWLERCGIFSLFQGLSIKMYSRVYFLLCLFLAISMESQLSEN